MSTKEIILVIGANGQIGTELVFNLRNMYGNSNVIATDITLSSKSNLENGPFEILDVMDGERLFELIKKYKVTQIYHLAALLSATSEKNPKLAWRLNIDGLLTVLDIAKEQKISKIFWPSSIAVFGPGTPKDQTPQHTVMDPNTVYGISKLAGERWCEYYCLKYGMDIRSIRYPGLIGYTAEPGGGTTDYAVHIFHSALKTHAYECFLSENTYLPMMYMPDAVRGTIELMNAEASRVRLRSGYNFSGMSFSPREIGAEIKKRIPDFSITYKSDFRQALADSWPKSIDDSFARNHWGWEHKYNLKEMTEDMLKNISRSLTASVKI